MAGRSDGLQDVVLDGVVSVCGDEAMKRPTKYCNYCKRDLDINAFSPKEWKLERGSRICCTCVRARKKHSANPKAGTEHWRANMPMHFKPANMQVSKEL